MAIGAMVDAAIVIIDNIHKRLHRWQSLDADPVSTGQVTHRCDYRGHAAGGAQYLFSLAIITISFMPVLLFWKARKGACSKPLAFTKSYPMAFAALLSITLVPALAVWLIRGKIRADRSKLNQWLVAAYRPVVALPRAFAGRWSAAQCWYCY